jgi:hypothetical protein
MKEKIIRILINAVLGALASIATIYLGAEATEAVAASGIVSGSVGGRVADVISAALA